jgi:hypothetical protein
MQSRATSKKDVGWEKFQLADEFAAGDFADAFLLKLSRGALILSLRALAVLPAAMVVSDQVNGALLEILPIPLI